MAGIAFIFTSMLLGVAVIALFIHVFVDIANLFEVSLVIALPFCEVVGYVLLARMLIFVTGPKKAELKKLIQEPDKSSASQNFGYGLLNSFILCLLILGTWLSAYLIHWIIL